VGGRSDGGIDLMGTWTVPSLPRPVRAIVQCKGLKTRVPPAVVRELEGAFAAAPAGWRGGCVVGVLCGRVEATKGLRDALRGCGRPVVWVQVAGEGRVGQVLWNAAVAKLGAEGVGVGVRYWGGGAEGAKEAVLTWKGEVWEPAGGEEDGGGGERMEEGLERRTDAGNG
jgi:hypothetical protein